MNNPKYLLREYISLCPDGMCNIDLLTEGEKRLKNEGFMILVGTIQRCGQKNQNGRIYPKEILEREMQRYQKNINENRALGELDHADSSVVELKNVSHMLIRSWFEGDDVKGVIKILKTPSGQIAEGLIKSGAQIGISSRALGSLTDSFKGSIVNENLQIITYDLVSEPSVDGAFMQLRENKEDYRKIFSKADRIYRALNDVLRKK